eukprot:g78766.t1
MEAEQIVRAHREAERRKTDAEGVRQAHLDQIKFQVGDIVLLYHPQVPKGVSSKLFTHWKGPYQIMEQTGPLNYKIRGYPPYTRSTSAPDLEQRALRRRAKKAADFFKDVLELINNDIQKKRAGAAPLTIEHILQRSKTWKLVLERAEEVEIHKKLAENAITLAKMRVAALPRPRARQPAAGDTSRRRRLSTSDEDEEDESSSSEEAEENTRERASGHNRQRQRTSAGDSNNAQSENAHVDNQAHGQVSEQQLQQQALIDGDREAGGHEAGASEVGSIDPAADLPVLDTFIVFEWIDYESLNNLKKHKAKKVKNFSLGKVTHVEVDDDDPALESTIHVNIWDHPPGSSQYTGEYLPAWICGDAEKQSMYNPSTEAEEYKP